MVHFFCWARLSSFYSQMPSPRKQQKLNPLQLQVSCCCAAKQFIFGVSEPSSSQLAAIPRLGHIVIFHRSVWHILHKWDNLDLPCGLQKSRWRPDLDKLTHFAILCNRQLSQTAEVSQRGKCCRRSTTWGSLDALLHLYPWRSRFARVQQLACAWHLG